MPSTSTPEATTTPLTTTTTETPITVITSTFEEPTSLLTTTTTETPGTTTTTTTLPTSTPETSTTLLTSTPSTSSPEIPTTLLTTMPSTSTPEATTSPLTTTTTETPITVITSTFEEPTSLLTTTTTETPGTTTTTTLSASTTEIPTTPLTTQITDITPTSKEPTTYYKLTTTTPETPETTTTITTPPTSTLEIPTTRLTSTTPETPETTTTITTPPTSTLEIPTTRLTTTTPETPGTTTTTASTSTPEIHTTPITTTTPETPGTTLGTTASTSTPETTTTPLTTTTIETPITHTTSNSERPTTSLITATPETPGTTLATTASTSTSERPTTPLTTTTTETPGTTLSTTASTATPETTTSPLDVITQTTKHLTGSQISPTPETPQQSTASTSGNPTTSPTSTTPATTTTTKPLTLTPEIPTTPITTTQTPYSTTSTTPVCKDPRTNQIWPDGTHWIEDCYRKYCYNSVIQLEPVECPVSEVPVCPRGQPELVLDKQGCCKTWQCNCQCDVYGDPHYFSFGSVSFDFLKNCTYTLVEEISRRHQLRISVDNYDCIEPSASCVKGIILKYRNNTVTLQVQQFENVQATLNQMIIQPPYTEGGIRFEASAGDIVLYLDEIRSNISLTTYNTLQINLAMEHFINNTQGQCGMCGGPSCVRRNGTVEDEDCCDKTAYEWIEDDPLKPYCQNAQKHVTCVTTTPTPSASAPPSPPTICAVLRHELFRSCTEGIDIENLVKNCAFDYYTGRNNITVCSSLEILADHCKKMGVCVEWRNLTSGVCDAKCPEGMIYDECRTTPAEVCQGLERVQRKDSDGIRYGCFCPGNQVQAEEHKPICVSECTNCKGPLGKPMLPGETWESNCQTCTCNNQTRTAECYHKPTTPAPTCDSGFTVITDCCNNSRCVEKTCEYNGKSYKVGQKWTDKARPCVNFRCTTEGTAIDQNGCSVQNCSEEFRVWDKNNCSYTCDFTCAVRLTTMTIQLEKCTHKLVLPTCTGYCASNAMWVKSGDILQLELDNFSCRENSYQMKEIPLVCGGVSTIYKYKHVTGCECRSLYRS